jgi:hypothetical protein
MLDIENPRDIMHAVLYECISQTFAVIGMAVAKWSLGLFLLRLVKETWHKVAIWATLAMLMSASLLCLFFFWLQCSPAYLWDRSIPGGVCELPQLGISIYLGSERCLLWIGSSFLVADELFLAACVFTDLFFAVFPWIFMWKLNMNQREKLVILSSMSLGLIAAAFGIKRTTEIPNLMTENYLKDSVGIIVWTAAEMAVTMICIGIPVCRPLYKDYIDRLTSRSTSKYKDISGNGVGAMPLRTIGGSEIPGSDSQAALDSKRRAAVPRELRPDARQSSYRTGDQSDEDILGEGVKVAHGDRFLDGDGIVVTEYTVTRQ